MRVPKHSRQATTNSPAYSSWSDHALAGTREIRAANAGDAGKLVALAVARIHRVEKSHQRIAQPVFREVLDQYFGAVPDSATEARI